MRFLFTLLLLSLASAAAAEASPGPASRADAVKIIAGLREIVTEEGVQRTEKVRIGGIDQYVSIRSHNPRNPVLLVLHGGPGWVAMPTSWWFAQGWEEYFTVIQWDQRSAGKTYAVNDSEAIAPTMTVERMHRDVDEIVQWARQRFDREKVLVLGHSWGSLLGLSLADRHPEWLHAYIGVAQGVDAPESERRGWRWTMDRAVAANSKEAVAELQAIAPYGVDDGHIPIEHVMTQRKWLNHFGGAAHNRPHAGFEGAAVALSPVYSDKDLRLVWEAQEYSVRHLLSAVLTTDLSHIIELKTPLFLFLGRHDRNVSSAVTAEWFEKVKAPAKKLIWFEHSAHELMVEEPGKTLVSLVNEVLPIAHNTGDTGRE
ncbi:alpha/beta fold hydrolase [Microbulbifer taiwanensis]|uniref:Proline iminopeptidase n=1 Tax=Microbulbifer taiwanensis TaxID=986746 RepID=A0ABW1YWI7_9GAMM|nr:alpha/beta fold hydrolase [Microbulbifer taiwanensis]